MIKTLIAQLLASSEPAVRYKTRVYVLGESPRSARGRAERTAIVESPRARALLSERDRKGEISFHPYKKWYGAHWVLVTLAELDYPPGDASLMPLRDRVCNWLLADNDARWIRVIKGVPRIHASMEGNAVWGLHKLGLADERVEKLVERLLATQWQDGGWNCDPEATGKTSSFVETLIPLRALALHANITNDKRVRAAADRAAEVFLQRHLYRRLRDGRVIDPHFIQLHYPCYYHYDILFALKVMTECGAIHDARCGEALDMLEAKRGAEGGWAAESKYYRYTQAMVPAQRSLVDWGPTGKTRRNDWVTADALMALRAAGRLTRELE